jgi:hypothetical protein
MADVAAGDINRDGLLDMNDVVGVFMGQLPRPIERTRLERKRSDRAGSLDVPQVPANISGAAITPEPKRRED